MLPPSFALGLVPYFAAGLVPSSFAVVRINEGFSVPIIIHPTLIHFYNSYLNSP
jgi:hypothetical protein